MDPGLGTMVRRLKDMGLEEGSARLTLSSCGWGLRKATGLFQAIRCGPPVHLNSKLILSNKAGMQPGQNLEVKLENDTPEMAVGMSLIIYPSPSIP